MHWLMGADKVPNDYTKKQIKSTTLNMKDNFENKADQMHCQRSGTRPRAFTYPLLSFEMDVDLNINSVVDTNKRTQKKESDPKFGDKPIGHSRSLQTLKCNEKDPENVALNTISKTNTTGSSDSVWIKKTTKMVPAATVTPQESPKDTAARCDSCTFINSQISHRNAEAGARDDIPPIPNRSQNIHIFQASEEIEHYRRYRFGIRRHYQNDENRVQNRVRNREQDQDRNDYVMSLSDDDTYYYRSQSIRPDHVVNIPQKTASLSFPPYFPQNRNNQRESHLHRANNDDENRYMTETDSDDCIRSPVHSRSRSQYEQNLNVRNLPSHRNSSRSDNRHSRPLPLMPFLRSSQDHDTDFDMGSGVPLDLSFPASTSPPSVAIMGASSNRPRMDLAGRIPTFSTPMSQWRLNSSQSLLSRSLSEFNHGANQKQTQDKRNCEDENNYASHSATGLNINDVPNEKTVPTSDFCWKKYPLLESFLIENSEDYFRYSALKYKYTAQQRNFHNHLTERILILAQQHGYNNLNDGTNNDFATIKKRIRSFYQIYDKSQHSLSSKKRYSCGSNVEFGD